jgi:hypothetical protein
MVLNYSTLFFPLYHTTYITGVDGDDYDGGGGGDGDDDNDGGDAGDGDDEDSDDADGGSGGDDEQEWDTDCTTLINSVTESGSHGSTNRSKTMLTTNTRGTCNTRQRKIETVFKERLPTPESQERSLPDNRAAISNTAL